jgi:hypothetical protein
VHRDIGLQAALVDHHVLAEVGEDDVAHGAQRLALLDDVDGLAEQQCRQARRSGLVRAEPDGLVPDRHQRQLREDVLVDVPLRAGEQAAGHAGVHLDHVFLVHGRGGLAAFGRLRDGADCRQDALRLADTVSADDDVIEDEAELLGERLVDDRGERGRILQLFVGDVASAMSFFSSRSMRRIFTFLAVTVSASAAQKACTPPQREPFARLVSSIAGNFTPLEFA